MKLTETIQKEYETVSQTETAEIKMRGISPDIQNRFIYAYDDVFCFAEKTYTYFTSVKESFQKYRPIYDYACELLSKIHYSPAEVCAFSFQIEKMLRRNTSQKINNESLLGLFFSALITANYTKTNTKDTYLLVVPKQKKLYSFLPHISCGNVRIKGDVGMSVLHEMSGGNVYIDGNCETWVAHSLSGGTVHIEGNVQSRIGEDMTGGTLFIAKNAGEEIGNHMQSKNKNTKITIAGNVTSGIGHYMEDGEINVRGTVMYFDPTRILGGIVRIKGKVENLMHAAGTLGEIHLYNNSGETTIFSEDGKKHLRTEGNMMIHKSSEWREEEYMNWKESKESKESKQNMSSEEE